MDLLELLAFITAVGVVGALVNRYLSLRDAQFRAKMISDSRKHVKTLKMQQQKAIQHNQQDVTVGDWVPELLDSLGLDPQVIFEEEMPEELEQYLPAIKGFLDNSGGIEGVAAKLLKPQEDFKGL